MIIKCYMRMLCCVAHSYLVIKQIEATCLFHIFEWLLNVTHVCCVVWHIVI